MKMKYDLILDELRNNPKKWLITGCAGFIGSNLLETLLLLNQKVVGVDNFSTGNQRNLEEVKGLVDPARWNNFKFINGDICDLDVCRDAIVGVDYVLHHAALGSVPRSLKDPISTNKANVDGFLNMLVASKEERVISFTYAASSSTYGDHPNLPKVEDLIGRPLSPYAVTKYVNELYADIFARSYDFKCIGLRYFNVFGKRQDPNGAYAAVIPKWIASMINDEDVFINGDGETSRDFCYIDNVVQANILASVADVDRKGEVYNIAVGGRTTLNQLASNLRGSLKLRGISYDKRLIYLDFRNGDVKHSQADISKARHLLGYSPIYDLPTGLNIAVDWYIKNLT